MENGNLLKTPSNVTYIIPYNISKYDIISHFANNKEILVRTDKLMKNGDDVLFYIATPYKEIKFKGVVVDEEPDRDIINANSYAIDRIAATKNKYVLVQMVCAFRDQSLPFDLIKSLGVGQVLKQCRCSNELIEYIKDNSKNVFDK